MFCDESKGFWKREEGEAGGEEVNPLVFLCSSLFSTFSPSLSFSLPPLFLETSHSRESGPSCSQRLGLASSRLPPPPLCPCLCRSRYQKRREPSRRKQNPSSLVSQSKRERGGEWNAFCEFFNSPYLHSWQVTDGCDCEHWRNNRPKGALRRWQAAISNLRLQISNSLRLWNKINVMMQPHFWHPS